MSLEQALAALNQNEIVMFYNRKRDDEISRLALTQQDETLCADALLSLARLNDDEERIAIHNIANVVRHTLEESEDYSLALFLKDCADFDEKSALNPDMPPELRYLNVLKRCPTLGVVVSPDFLGDTLNLLSSLAAKQNYFLIELVAQEIENQITYGLNSVVEPFSVSIIENTLHNLQPFAKEQKQVEFTEQQANFLSLFLLHKALNVAEGVFKAECLLSEQFGFNFNKVTK